MKGYIFSTILFLLSLQSIAQKKTYEYDDLNRLSKAHYWEGSSIKATVTYSFDEVGNRVSKTVAIICTNPTAHLTRLNYTIISGQTANITVSLTGDYPMSIIMNGITYTATSSGSNGGVITGSGGGVILAPYTIPVSPTTTTSYTLTSVSNSCGIGTVSGTSIVNVNPCLLMYSVLSGNWNANNTWSCNRQPTVTDDVTISSGHTVTIPAGQTGFLKNLILNGTVVNSQLLKFKSL